MWEYKICAISYCTIPELEAALNVEGQSGYIMCDIVDSAIDRRVEPPIITADIIFRKEIIVPEP